MAHSLSWPDAAYVVGIMLQFMQNPGPVHWEGLKLIINYLRSMKDLWLTFGGQKEMMIEGFCDADWASQKHRHLISSFSFHFSVGVISWSSKKQGVVSLSSTEVEYVTQMHAAKEGIWLRSFIKEIQGGAHHLMRQSGSHHAGQGQQISCKDKAHRPMISCHP